MDQERRLVGKIDNEQETKERANIVHITKWRRENDFMLKFRNQRYFDAKAQLLVFPWSLDLECRTQNNEKVM